MFRFLPIWGLLTAIACGLVAPVFVTALIHWWKIPVDVFFPGAWSLFLLPIALTALVQLVQVKRWRSASVSSGVISTICVLLGTLLGIVMSAPLICGIANECL
jgi:hypothetical protein